MTNKQMELAFAGLAQARTNCRRQRRLERAAWWFAQMRQVVDRAFDWQPAPPARPEQTWLPGTQRTVHV